MGAERAREPQRFRSEAIAPALAGWKATHLRLSGMPGGCGVPAGKSGPCFSR
ncbi:MAG: hypothetical protein OJF48_001049 [Afipia sp.]|nr:MAG: hypothetical protein OJF48_001049 [Afipia sp.]